MSRSPLPKNIAGARHQSSTLFSISIFINHSFKISKNMKKLNVFFAGVFFLLLSTGASAQTKTGADYFAGKWTVLLKGTPGGDSKMIFVLEKKDDKITGVVQDTTGAEISKLSNVELKDTAITLYFTAQGYDVNLLLTKKDDDHVTGSLMSMFDAEGERKKESPESKK